MKNFEQINGKKVTYNNNSLQITIPLGETDKSQITQATEYLERAKINKTLTFSKHHLGEEEEFSSPHIKFIINPDTITYDDALKGFTAAFNSPVIASRTAAAAAPEKPAHPKKKRHNENEILSGLTLKENIIRFTFMPPADESPQLKPHETALGKFRKFMNDFITEKAHPENPDITIQNTATIEPPINLNSRLTPLAVEITIDPNYSDSPEKAGKRGLNKMLQKLHSYAVISKEEFLSKRIPDANQKQVKGHSGAKGNNFFPTHL